LLLAATAAVAAAGVMLTQPFTDNRLPVKSTKLQVVCKILVRMRAANVIQQGGSSLHTAEVGHYLYLFKT